jgi:hypothetical protein
LPENDNRSYAEYTIEHLAYVLEDTKELLRDVLYSIGLTRTSEKALLRTAKGHIDFVSKVLDDSTGVLHGTKFRAYSDPNEELDAQVCGEECCKDED